MLGTGRARAGRVWGFTLVEVMVVVAIIGLLLALALPSLATVRQKSRYSICQAVQMRVDHAKERLAMDARLHTGDTCTMEDILPYLSSRPECPAGGELLIEPIGTPPNCTLHGHAP